MYKALFELARDRAEFMSMLFSKPRPAGLGPAVVRQRFVCAPSRRCRRASALYKKTLRGDPGASDDDAQVPDLGPGPERASNTCCRRFYSSGFAVRASPTYADLMTATDTRRHRAAAIWPRKPSFAFLKGLQQPNLVVPVVGDFGGPKAIRAIGRFLKGAWRPRERLLSVERRAVSLRRREMARVLRECRGAAPGRREHVHPVASEAASSAADSCDSLGAMATEVQRAGICRERLNIREVGCETELPRVTRS